MPSRIEKGFTLIELMIVVAIIGILATIAIPSYNRYVIRTQNNSCLMEAKAYTQLAINTINDGRNVSAPSFGACTFITDASSWTVMNTISGISPGDRNTTCAPNGTCTLD